MARRPSFLAAGLGLTVVLAGCGGATSNTPAPAPALSASSIPAASSSGPAVTDANTTWVDGFCGSLLDLVALSTLQPPQNTKQSYDDVFGKVESALAAAVDKLNKLPAAPVAAGDTDKKTLVDVFTPALQQIKDARSKLASASDAQAVIQAQADFQAVGATVTKIEDPLKDIKASPELEPARKVAPNCQKLPQ
jgi:hypothetical protein